MQIVKHTSHESDSDNECPSDAVDMLRGLSVPNMYSETGAGSSQWSDTQQNICAVNESANNSNEESLDSAHRKAPQSRQGQGTAKCSEQILTKTSGQKEYFAKYYKNRYATSRQYREDKKQSSR